MAGERGFEIAGGPARSVAADVAQFMGLKTPASTTLIPSEFIDGMRELNTSKDPAETASFTSMREPLAPRGRSSWIR